MLNSDEIVIALREMILSAYGDSHRFTSAEELETCLECYHQFWAMIHEAQQGFLDALKRSDGLAQIRHKNPAASDAEIRRLVVAQWRGISEQLGIIARNTVNGR